MFVSGLNAVAKQDFRDTAVAKSVAKEVEVVKISEVSQR
jgi:hypothetical protein